MARPKKIRQVSRELKNVNRHSAAVAVLQADELEAMRLCDGLELEQNAAARKMTVSRPTVQRLLYSGRKKVSDALLAGRSVQLVFPDFISFK